jgi:hypothetical protein
MNPKKHKTTSESVIHRHRASAIPNTKFYVPNYPQKLYIYKNAASRFYWVRYYAENKILRQSTKTESKQEALQAAKAFYDDIQLRIATGKKLGKKSSFAYCANDWLSQQNARVATKSLSKESYKQYEYRLKKYILPYLGDFELTEIDYQTLNQFLTYISSTEDKLSVATVKMYLGIVGQIMTHAEKINLISRAPHLPKVRAKTNARGYFTVSEYRKLWSRARALSGKGFQYRKLTEEEAKANGYGDQTLVITECGTSKLGRFIKRVDITDDLYQLIIFMINSFVRPTDIKNMQHKHVEIVEHDHTYLYLKLPPSKNKKDPIITMPKAVEVYRRHKANYQAIEKQEQQNYKLQLSEFKKINKDFSIAKAEEELKSSMLKQRERKALITKLNLFKKLNQGLPTFTSEEDYVFLPQYKDRKTAIKQLQNQFDVLLSQLNLRISASGEERSMYSLRHTCITYRYMYGEKIDLLVLARNARTSPEMIDKHYASKFSAIHNIEMIQSRKPTKRKKFKLDEIPIMSLAT